MTALPLTDFLWRQAWLRPWLGKWLYRRLSTAGRPPDCPFETDFFGLCYQGNWNNNVEFSIYHYGAFEKPLLFFLRDTLMHLQPRNGVFVDVGANVGQHSLFMARHGATVHAFEPFAPVRQRLEHHIALNRIESITVHPVGLGSQDAALTFYAPTGTNQGIGSFNADSQARGTQPVGELAVVNGDNWLAAHGVDPVHLLKIDVEGFERATLAGLRRTLSCHRPVVVVEITYDGADSFPDAASLSDAFPADYAFFTFDLYRADGRKARRQESRAKRSGHYRLIPYRFHQHGGQDDVIACPAERLDQLPRGG